MISCSCSIVTSVVSVVSYQKAYNILKINNKHLYFNN